MQWAESLVITTNHDPLYTELSFVSYISASSVHYVPSDIYTVCIFGSF